MIILLVAWFNVGFQVLPPLFLTLYGILERKMNPFGRARIKHLSEEATMKMVAVQQKQVRAHIARPDADARRPMPRSFVIGPPCVCVCVVCV